MGGEKTFPLSERWQFPGSPPHGRGKAMSEGGTNDQQRITPAWAGKSVQTDWTTTSRRDHPRMGGEKRIIFQLGGSQQGSPPHGRGKDLQETIQLIKTGITPAWAGKSHRLPCAAFLPRDHPRMGGEKLLHWRKQEQRNGITPAWAGKRTHLH